MTQIQKNTIEFSVPVVGVVIAIVSMNGNTYVFDKDFTILSQSDGIQWSSGYWGMGSFSKTASSTSFNLIGNGAEPHGAIQLAGTLSTFSFSTTIAEVWNGFTVGIQSIAPASCSCPPCPYCAKILDSTPSRTVGNNGECTITTKGTITFPLSTPGQRVYLASDSRVIVAPYFDDMGVLTVLSPKKVLRGKNIRVWNEDCKNTSFSTLTMYYGAPIGTAGASILKGSPVDISSLFNNEVGDFIVSLDVRDKYNPTENMETWICTGPSFGPSPPYAIAVSTDPTISSTVITGFSGGEVAGIAVGSVIGVVLLAVIAVIAVGAVGYTIAKKKTSPDLVEKLVN